MVEHATLRLFEVLGRGSQGVVRRARLCHAAGPQREVAIKHLLPAEDIQMARRAIARLRDEATALAALNHPAIPDFIDLFVVEGSLAMATRFIDGYDLGTLLEEGRFLSPRAAAAWLATTADALASGWSSPGPDDAPLRLIHRDIKPSNLRLDRDGRPWLLDFGLARGRTLRRHAETEVAGVVGTPGYLSPQRWQGEDADRADDVFALGLIAVEMLGAPPAITPLERTRSCPLALRSSEAWGRRREVRLAELDDVGDPLVALCREMLAWEPDQRPSAEGVRDRLRAMMPDLEGPDLRAWAGALPPPPPPSDMAVREVIPVPLGSDGEPVRASRRARWVSASGWVWGGLVALLWAGSVWGPCDGSVPALADGVLTTVEGGLGVDGERTTAQERTPEPPGDRSGPDSDPGEAETPTPDEPRPAAAGVVAPTAPVRPEVPAPRPSVPAARGPATPTKGTPSGEAVAGEEAREEGSAEPDAPEVTWRASGSIPVRLVRHGLRVAPGPLTAGLWEIEADFGGGYEPAGEVVVPSSGEVVVRCMPWLGLCEGAP